jgi:CheY-like chemotaxis protein
VLDVAALYGHLPILRMSEQKRQILLDLYQSDKPLAGRRVLIVDDDIRNIFALSTVLEEHEMDVVSADNGRDAIERLRQDSDIDIVLMDIMMPEMDGMETMREIRKISSLKELPIVAVTAKAMKGDREKCIEAGAWDYLAKPVDGNQMLAVLRAWLHR